MLVLSRFIHDPDRFVEGRVFLDFTHLSDADLARLRGGEMVVVTVVDIRGDKARLGFDGPESVRFQRAEVIVHGDPRIGKAGAA